MDEQKLAMADLIAAVKEYNGRLKGYLDCYSYYRGQQELKYATQTFRNEYGQQFEGLRENLLPGLVTSFTDNLEIASWGSTQADKMESDLGLKSLIPMTFDEAFRCGDGYVLAWPNSKGVNVPHFLKASQCVPRVDQDDPTQLAWLARCWPVDKRLRVNIYYADRLERWITATDSANLDANDHVQITAEWPAQESSWIPYEGNGTPGDGGPVIPHNYKTVPAIWLKQDPMDPYSHGVSLLADAIPLQDMLNRELADTMVLAGTYSKPFWYLLNYEPPQGQNNPLLAAQQFANAYSGVQQSLAGTPHNGSDGFTETANKFDRTKQSIFAHDGKGPFGQLEPPDLAKLLDLQDRIALKMARVIGLPSYYLTQTSGDVPSGASLRVLRQRMTSRIAKFQAISGPVLKGLGELLGMGEVDITWVKTAELDPLEAVDMAVAKKRDLGYTLADAIADLDEEDAAGIVQRAEEKAAEAVKQFEDGELSMDPDEEDDAPAFGAAARASANAGNR